MGVQLSSLARKRAWVRPVAHYVSEALHRVTLLIAQRSYPEGNFGENQLPGGSISLSPLYPGQAATICTSVLRNASFHRSFRPASPCPGIAHRLSGLNRGTRSPFGALQHRVSGADSRLLTPLGGSYLQRLAPQSNSLVRVPRRVEW